MLKTNMLLLFLSLFSLAASSQAAYESKVVGQAGEEILTTRQVNAYFIFSEFYQNKTSLAYSLPLKEEGLMSATSNLLMDFLIVKEADSFSFVNIPSRKIKSTIQTFQRKLRQNKAANAYWKDLAISNEELNKIAATKIRSEAFLNKKKETFNISVMDAEIERELKNGDKTTKEEVKNEILNQKKQEAIREWFQILRTKYVVKNLLLL